MREAPALILLAVLGVAATVSLFALRPVMIHAIEARTPSAALVSGWNDSTVVIGNPYEAGIETSVWEPGAIEMLVLPGLSGAAFEVSNTSVYLYTGCILPGDAIDLTSGRRLVSLTVYTSNEELRERLGRCGARLLTIEDLAEILNETSGGAVREVYRGIIVAYPRLVLPEDAVVDAVIDTAAGVVLQDGAAYYIPSTAFINKIRYTFVVWRRVEPGTLIYFRLYNMYLDTLHTYAVVNITEDAPYVLSGSARVVELPPEPLVQTNLSYTVMGVELYYRGVLYNPREARRVYLVEAGPVWLHIVYTADSGILVHPVPPETSDPARATCNPIVKVCYAADPWSPLHTYCYMWWSSILPAVRIGDSYYPPRVRIGAEAILLRDIRLFALNTGPVAVTAPPASVVCWWIDYDHDGVRDIGEVACAWTRDGRVEVRLPRIDAYNATVWVASTASGAPSLAVLPGGGLEATSVDVEGLVINATLPGGSLRVSPGTVVYAEASCTTRLELVDSAGHGVSVSPIASGVEVSAGYVSKTLPCATGYRVYWLPNGLVTVETDVASTTMGYAPPQGRVRLEADGEAWMGLLPAR